MKVISIRGEKRVGMRAGRGAFPLLVNLLGDYVSFSAEERSRYGGWNIREGGGYVKVIDSLDIDPARASPSAITFDPNFVISDFGTTREEIWLEPECHVLRLEYSRPVKLTPCLDVRKEFEFPEWERAHRLTIENGTAVIEARAGTARVYLVVSVGGGAYEERGEWREAEYERDRARNSPPWKRYVHAPLSCVGRSFVFAIGGNEREAVEMARRKQGSSKTKKCFSLIGPQPVEKGPGGDAKVQSAVFGARHALSALYFRREGAGTLVAGLPWFGKWWLRDAAIASSAFPRSIRNSILKCLWEKLRHAVPPGGADGAGWLFFRLGQLSARDLRAIDPDFRNTLPHAVAAWRKERLRGLFLENAPQETWMDSIDRGGARIEIQALLLNAYRLAERVAADGSWRVLELETRDAVRRAFWNGETLHDGVHDPTMRPNCFLAAYAYPELLPPRDWEICFKTALQKLWLPWGGVSTIERGDSRYEGYSTGENPKSYHNGDSWFYLNNVAALAMHRINARRFRPYIKKVLEASTKDIVTEQALGYPSELTSAEEFKPGGAWNQAWSASTYLELVRESSRKGMARNAARGSFEMSSRAEIVARSYRKGIPEGERSR